MNASPSATVIAFCWIDRLALGDICGLKFCSDSNPNLSLIDKFRKLWEGCDRDAAVSDVCQIVWEQAVARENDMVDTIDTIDANSFLYRGVKQSQLTNGAASVPVCKSNGERLAFQTSFGLHDKLLTNFTVTLPQSGDPTRCNLDLKFQEYNQALKDFLFRVDECILEESLKHPEWFRTFSMKGEFSMETLKKMYQPLVKQNQMYGASTRAKIVLPSEKNKYPTQIFVVVDEDVEEGETIIRYKKGDYTDLEKGTQCIVTVDTQGIWLAKALNTFGMSLTATTVLVWKCEEYKGKGGGVGSFKLGDTVLVREEAMVASDDELVV